MYVKNIIFGVLLHVVAKMENTSSIIDDSAITCDEIMDVEAKSKDEETTFLTNFIEKKSIVKHKISIFWLHFY